ncbi:UrcA family protein [Novosphingobium sp.]|jgi:UrcA family protein|uniref:UrcA family protein n=1 Tax=Novosphingobium sp. TaxID=1874826 RepID=UPI0031DDCDCB
MNNFNRFTTALAASLGVVATFAIGMTPMVAHAATFADSAEAGAPVEHVEMDENGVPSLRVSYAGLDLSNEQGRKEMDHRLARAATRVCEPLRVASIEADRSIAYQNCRSDAIAQGHNAIDGLGR